MAWIYCVLWIFLLQITNSKAYEETEWRSGRAPHFQSNGSYKILNRFVKPFISRRVMESPIVFPDLTSRSGSDFALQIPEECRRLGICEDIPNYPEDIVYNVIQQIERDNKTKFNRDVLEPPQIAERIGPEEETIDLCVSSERIFVPKVAQDVNKDWYIIVNDKQKPRQTFRVEICKGGESASCSSIAFFQKGYEAKCIQKYVLRNMIALDDQNEVIERPFQVPSCCSCVARVV
ncbi:protein spaetzle-like isoform X1 [Zerene cesonia]|uniref:protein spaetzle-like isoform X1 n=1 Tax=Zerene cesonia TaxID=33412 RepID=UPI0018E57D70|nr:protein spaetzle-like isoform X1 [Zerene cesonia]